jgi:hypothetical protein
MIEKTLSKIDETLGRVRTHPEYSPKLANEVVFSLMSEADKHSSNLELEDGSSKTGKEIPFKSREFVANLKRAREYVGEHGFNMATFAVLGNIIEPGPNVGRTFRSGEVTFGDLSGVPSERIHSEVDNLIYFLNHRQDVHPVIRASNGHLEFVRIHPYGDGNGRTARLVQNVALEQRGYPPAVINSAERGLYLGILNGTLKDRTAKTSHLENPSYSEVLFHEFIASRVLNSAQLLEAKLRSNRVFKIDLTNLRGRGISYTLKNVLAGFHSQTNGNSDNPIHVHLDKSHGSNATYTIRGNIGAEEIRHKLQHHARKYGFKYDVKSIV